MAESRLLATLRAFQGGNVEFILVGGLAAVLRGAPIQTYDMDLVYAVDAENVERLQPVLESMGAIFRLQPERKIKPTQSHLAGGGHLNLITRYGPLDLLGSIGNSLGYRDLLPQSPEMTIGVGISIRVLSLEAIIAVKEQLGGEKDLAVLPLLRRTLRESKK